MVEGGGLHCRAPWQLALAACTRVWAKECVHVGSPVRGLQWGQAD